MNKENRKYNYVSIINTDKSVKKINQISIQKILTYGFIFVILIQISIIFYFFRFEKIILNQIYLEKSSNETKLNKKELQSLIENSRDFNEDINQKYLYLQKYLCQSRFLFNNTNFEEQIKIVKANINHMVFDMYVYKTNTILSNAISSKGFYEYRETNTALSTLIYYSKKENIPKNKIYILDIGANIGWYTLTLAKEGYNIIAFEPSKINYYILLKNYCLHEDINVTIINKGLDIEEKSFSLYHPLNNIENGISFDGKDLLNNSDSVKEEIIVTKLSHYLDYLKGKYLAFIKIDVEGSEGKVLEGGLDLITDYHIPFILMEWTPDYLKLKGTDPNIFIDMFEKNGYKFSITSFLDHNYISKEDLLKIKQKNIFIVYEKYMK